MIGDEKTLRTGLFDGKEPFSGSPLNFFDQKFYFTSAKCSKGLHTFESDGEFSIFVKGSYSDHDSKSSYGYLPAFNSLIYNLFLSVVSFDFLSL